MIAKEKSAGTAQLFAKTVLEGGLVVFPTETVYGIGCDATNAKAVAQVYKAKKRRKEKILPVVFADLKHAQKYVSLSRKARFLAEKFMPGPLTLVVFLKKKLAACANSKTVAFRISSNKLLSKASALSKKPLVATSANLSGKPPVSNFAEAKKTFLGKASLFIDGGVLSEKKPSTIIDLTGKKIGVVREGAVELQKILKALKKAGLLAA